MPPGFQAVAGMLQSWRWRPRLRSVAVNLGLAGVSSLAVLALVEIGLRCGGYDPVGGLRKGKGRVLRESEIPGLVYQLEPGSEVDAWATHVSIGQQGLRDRDYPIPKPTRHFRMAVLGDSVVFGYGVKLEDTFVKRLERRLNRRPVAPGIVFEVLDMGVPGYDTLQEALFLQRAGLGFQPDAVVVAYCLNDAIDTSPSLAHIRRLSHFRSGLYWFRTAQLIATRVARWRESRAEMESTPSSITRNLALRSAALDPETRALMRQLAGTPVVHPNQLIAAYAEPARVALLRLAFDRLATIHREHQLPLVVAFLPVLGTQDRNASDLALAIAERQARQAGLDTWRLGLASQPDQLEGLRVNPDDELHPNAQGHALIADDIEPRVRSLIASRLVPES